jgi:FAD/FMN-containing dehydrogenase
LNLVQLTAGTPAPKADVNLVDANALRRELERQLEGEIRFDQISRALYSTDASVYQIRPLGLVIPKTRQDIVRTVEICHRFRCPLTMRGGGTSPGRRSAMGFRSTRRNITTTSSK